MRQNQDVRNGRSPRREETSMPPLQVGDKAPSFVAETHTGQTVRTDDFLGRRAVVVYFYPKDGTPICTTEACTFRDAYEDFVKAGAVVIGVSADSLEQHRSFAAQRNLPFLLVSDADGSLRRAFRVPKTWGIFPGRLTYVIDRDGIVRHVLNAQWNGRRHVDEALEVVRRLPIDPSPRS
jgi:peroxiredoxin Q/BCP